MDIVFWVTIVGDSLRRQMPKFVLYLLYVEAGRSNGSTFTNAEESCNGRNDARG